jgi:hypothetical protein
MTIEAVIDLIEMGAVAPQDIVKCLRSSLRDTPQRTWVALTKQDAEQLVDDCDWYNDPVSFCFDVEAKLKEKNHG